MFLYPFSTIVYPKLHIYETQILYVLESNDFSIFFFSFLFYLLLLFHSKTEAPKSARNLEEWIKFPDGDSSFLVRGSFKEVHSTGWVWNRTSAHGNESQLNVKYRYICGGAMVCPTEGCAYRAMTHVARSTRPEKGEKPFSFNRREFCHGSCMDKNDAEKLVSLVVQHCSCSWSVCQNGVDVFLLTHKGFHSHPKPPVVRHQQKLLVENASPSGGLPLFPSSPTKPRKQSLLSCFGDPTNADTIRKRINIAPKTAPKTESFLLWVKQNPNLVVAFEANPLFLLVISSPFQRSILQDRPLRTWSQTRRSTWEMKRIFC